MEIGFWWAQISSHETLIEINASEASAKRADSYSLACVISAEKKRV